MCIRDSLSADNSPADLQGLLQGKSIQNLTVAQDCPEDTFNALVQLIQGRQIVELCMKKCKIPGASLLSLFERMELPAGAVLRKIDLEETRVNDAVLERVGLVCPNLQELNVSGCDPEAVTDAGLVALASKCTELRTVLASYMSSFTDYAVLALAACNPHLTRVHFSDCPEVSDVAVCGLARCCPLLQSVHFSDCDRVTDKSLVILGQKSTHLRRIWFPSCMAITDQGVLSVLRGCPELQVLVLSGCTAVGDAAIQAVAEHGSHINTLEVSDCSKVTSQSVPLLSKCPELRTLLVDGCTLTPESVHELRQARPDLEVHGDGQ
eukprot:TRINITY_DN11812_c0_g1_i2.p1 TRINITY_DN11812_c0_g1~~TRINITY_DN11812_c0_g1_i2.p1  ORF type:complete len:322 (-),score=64.48 TRINITY_DN11812_c0_g1_i2:178-1143(-)